MGMWRTTAAALLLPGMAQALTFAVTSTADEEDMTPGNAVCASATGACTLRAAIQEANALVGTDVVTVPAGTYVLTLTGDGENDGLTGDLDVRDTIEIEGAGRDATIIDGGSADRVFHVHARAGFTLSGVTVRNGLADAGGGIRHEGEAPLVVRAAGFDANTATQGAAIFHGDGALTVTDVVFSDNVATNVGGGIAKFAGSQEVSGCAFRGNVGLGAGGAIYHAGTGSIAVAGSTFRDHYGNAGGCLFVQTDGGALTLTGSRFERCFASAGAPGGGVYFASTSGGLTVADSAFTDGVAVVGAGVFADTAAGITVTGSTFAGNFASSGGGGLFRDGEGTTTLQGVRFAANRGGTGQGGGAALRAKGDVTVAGAELVANQASGGAGLLVTTDAGLTVAGARFADHLGTGGAGGAGLLATAGVGIALRDATFVGNTTINAAGGGANLQAPTFVTVERTTFAGNAAQGAAGFGGGLAAAAAAVTITNATFSGNFAGAGGGVFAPSPTSVSSSTFVGNRAITNGSAILNDGTVTLRGTVVAASSGAAACGGFPITSAGDNVDQDGACGLAGPRDRAGIDPQLGSLADAGDGALTHAPLPGSPLIDADGGACPPVDQRNVPRPADGDGDGTAVCDVGAVEFVDECPSDPGKVLPGICGCGVADLDADANGVADCLRNAEMKLRIGGLRGRVGEITGAKDDAQKQLKAAVKAGADDVVAYAEANAGALVLADPVADLTKLGRKARLAVRKTLRGKGKKLRKKQTKATAALDAMDAAVAPQ
ncbi:MAG: CSLREA domain-containing protein [bacterium]|nr:CSLREA domain-containing protein [bacterium]